MHHSQRVCEDEEDLVPTLPPDLNRASVLLDEYGQAQFGGSAPDASFLAPPQYETLLDHITSWDDSALATG